MMNERTIIQVNPTGVVNLDELATGGAMVAATNARLLRGLVIAFVADA